MWRLTSGPVAHSWRPHLAKRRCLLSKFRSARVQSAQHALERKSRELQPGRAPNSGRNHGIVAPLGPFVGPPAEACFRCVRARARARSSCGPRAQRASTPCQFTAMGGLGPLLGGSACAAETEGVPSWALSRAGEPRWQAAPARRRLPPLAEVRGRSRPSRRCRGTALGRCVPRPRHPFGHPPLVFSSLMHAARFARP